MVRASAIMDSAKLAEIFEHQIVTRCDTLSIRKMWSTLAGYYFPHDIRLDSDGYSGTEVTPLFMKREETKATWLACPSGLKANFGIKMPNNVYFAAFFYPHNDDSLNPEQRFSRAEAWAREATSFHAGRESGHHRMSQTFVIVTVGTQNWIYRWLHAFGQLRLLSRPGASLDFSEDVFFIDGWLRVIAGRGLEGTGTELESFGRTFIDSLPEELRQTLLSPI